MDLSEIQEAEPPIRHEEEVPGVTCSGTLAESQLALLTERGKRSAFRSSGSCGEGARTVRVEGARAEDLEAVHLQERGDEAGHVQGAP